MRKRYVSSIENDVSDGISGDDVNKKLFLFSHSLPHTAMNINMIIFNKAPLRNKALITDC